MAHVLHIDRSKVTATFTLTKHHAYSNITVSFRGRGGMWSGLVRAITPQSAPRRLEIPINPLATPPHFPPFERKSLSGQFEIVHAPTHQRSHNTITLPTGLLVLESSTSTPRNDLLHDILISIPPGHWTKLKDQQGHVTALQTCLLLVKSPLIREVHQELTRAHQEGIAADHTNIYAQIG